MLIALIILTTIALLGIIATIIVQLYFQKKALNKPQIKNEEIAEQIKNQLKPELETIKRDMSDSIKEDLVRKLNENKELVESKLNFLSQRFLEINQKNISNLNEELKKSPEAINVKFDDLRTNLDRKLKDLSEATDRQVAKIKEEINEHFKSKVQEKLEEQFKDIQDEMLKLRTSVTDFKTLQTDVQELNKIFTNSKLRGNYGEMNLETLLKDMFTQDNWAKNVNIKKLSADEDSLKNATIDPTEDDINYKTMVDFVVKHYENNELKYIPIDCKFPLEDYNRYLETGDLKYKKDLISRVKKMAKDIATKYINPPITTNYAVMYIPSESILAELIDGQDGFDVILNLEEKKILCLGPLQINLFLSNLRYNTKQYQMNKNSEKILALFEKTRKIFKSTLENLEKTKNSSNKITENIEKTLRDLGKINNNFLVLEGKPNLLENYENGEQNKEENDDY
ncbi:RmuC family [Metamycoplasma arthritidis]|uniref:RmuC domain protein n=1 Tax=Metamycoplasma arthritidis (strain 158L3-1) TaxID=243272 RepID=B3PMT9_META1|nr:DNA recombination protein RmuC [Metamycoplasma arthritidis]ACF07341.1 RmuC domain protein [Metamycoplasma arthritidis 158L3-1]VEU78864.1 RmuC family [Metamycoplasma arthritidis]